MSLYRIVNFFELLQTLRIGRLRVPSAMRFTDPNEMIGYYFATMADPLFTPRTEKGIEQALSEQRTVRESNYISCWTRAENSIAMWEIYSPQRMSAQIEVGEDQLCEVFSQYASTNSFASARHTPPNFDKTYFYPPNIGDCRYEDLGKLAKSLKARTRAKASSAAEALENQGFDEFRRHFSEASDDAARNHSNLFFLKDRAYAHEQEVRFCVHAMRRNDRPYPECSEDPDFLLSDTHLRASSISEIGDNIFIDFPSSLIQSVSLDGRAPAWLIDEQRALLKDRGINATQSTSYGAFADRYSLEIWWNSDPT